jgi:hypothetical protein
MSKEKITKVAEIIDETKIVINSGSSDGIRVGEYFLILSYGAEVKDPDTGESLGKLENFKGTGKIVHVQEKIAILESVANTKFPIRLLPGEQARYAPLSATLGFSTVKRVFVEIGDLAIRTRAV